MRHGLRKDGGEGTELEMRARIPEKTVERYRVKTGKSTEKAAKNVWAREHLIENGKCRPCISQNDMVIMDKLRRY